MTLERRILRKRSAMRHKSRKEIGKIEEEPIIERISISPPPDKDRRYTSKLTCVMFKQSVKGTNLYPEHITNSDFLITE